MKKNFENKYCYGSHSQQARMAVALFGEKAKGTGCNKIVNQRIAKRLGKKEK